ncbi:MAG: sulfatase [Planctomycetes bacterium]|nr:sulfatase [Planctomycetota bacterium]
MVLALVAPTCGEREADASGDRPARAGGPSLLLVCIDTLRADRLGCYGYERHATTPNLDALAAEGLRFADVTAAAGWTKPSVPSFLTGSVPAAHGVYAGSARGIAGSSSDVLPSEVDTLAEILHDAGWDTAAFLRNAQLRAGLGFEQGFDVYHEEPGDASALVDAALAWLDARRDARPFFLYLHVLDVHMPYDVPDAAATRWADAAAIEPFRGDDWRATRDALDDGRVILDAPRRAALDALYDGALRHVDEQLGRLLADLSRRGLRDELVVSVVADHGEEFLEHGRFGHGHGLWQNLLAVPWILNAPGLEPAIVRAPVALSDLLPTLLGAVGLGERRRDLALAPVLDVLGAVDRLRDPSAPATLFAEHQAPDAYLQSLRRGRYKLVRRFAPPERPSEPWTLVRALTSGVRFEVGLALDRHGVPLRPLAARSIEPGDEDAGDPLAVRGRVLRREGDLLALDVLDVLLAPDCRVTGEGNTLAEAGPGRGVKVEGRFEGDAFVADKIKLYEAGASPSPQLRGTIAAAETLADGALRVRLGGFDVLVDANTKLDDLPDAPAHDAITRGDVHFLLEGGTPAALAAGWELQHSLFDLEADPGELSPLLVLTGDPRAADDADEAARMLAQLSAQLDALGSRLVRHALWEADGALLDSKQLDDLRALGYVR